MYVSPVFADHKVPNHNLAKKARQSTLPKHMSGANALAFFAMKKEKKDKENEAKLRRKAEREENKRKKEEEKLDKAKRKEAKAIERQNRSIKLKSSQSQKKKSSQRKRILESDSESSESEGEVVLDESDEEDGWENIDKESCAKCGEGEKDGVYGKFIGCDDCPRWWHFYCAGDPDLLELSEEELCEYSFTCLMCVI